MNRLFLPSVQVPPWPRACRPGRQTRGGDQRAAREVPKRELVIGQNVGGTSSAPALSLAVVLAADQLQPADDVAVAAVSAVGP